MEPNEIKEVVENAKDKSNKVLIECRDELSIEFEKTKELIIQLTRHMDAVQESYEVINEELGKRTL
jgi:hypothetical protein